jgi:hypothetical protein
MASIAWDAIKGTLTVPSGSTASGSVVVPRATTSMTLFLPATMDGTTLDIQSLSPVDGTTWNTISFVELATGTLKPLTITFASVKVIVFPIDIVGGGNIRINQGTSAAADRVYGVLFTKSD